ncbi:dihydroxyacetone kinase subunit L [Marispirochaeta sp.]|uniref:dihydroxyacetone kinase family protein n=1 Tax=Marispirochaeta sp. TaxID=2038653 RepID=UPI0029C76905|nr:dihydroxyacetone kinase subunit L [Marispirochaeta sp.]
MYLIELDSAVGDGDLGITMEKGFLAAAALAAAMSESRPGSILMKAGIEIAKVAPSTMGTLMGTGLMRGGKAVIGKDSLNASDMVDFFAGFLQGVTDRGKAKAGEKTILDVLIPMVDAMRAYKGTDITEVLGWAKKGAIQGIENEKTMMSQHGKAAVFREKTIGVKDPGSEAVLLMIGACYESMKNRT